MKYIIRTLLLACCCMQAQAQAPWKPDTELEKQLQQSNHVHRIMKANPAHAGLTRWERKKVLKSRGLPWPKISALCATPDPEPYMWTVKSLSQAKEVSVWTLLPPGQEESNKPELRHPGDYPSPRPGRLAGIQPLSVWVYVDAPAFI